MKFVVTKQHYDLTPGTVVEYLGESDPETKMHGVRYIVARGPGGFKVTLPDYKVELQKGNTEVFSPFETVNS